MADPVAPFSPYAGIEGAALTGGEGGDFLHKLLLGVIGGTAAIPKRVIDAAANTAQPGLRREDYTDKPAPMGMTAPMAWQPGDEQRGAALEAASMMMAGAPAVSGVSKAGEVALGIVPVDAGRAFKAGAAPATVPAKSMDAAAVARSKPDGTITHSGSLVISKRGDQLIAELDGKPVGAMSLSWRGPYATSVEVAGSARRQGVATQLYDAAETVLGRSVIPSPLGISDEAMKLWKRRLSGLDPEARQALLKEAARIGADAGVGRSAAERMRKLGLEE